MNESDRDRRAREEAGLAIHANCVKQPEKAAERGETGRVGDGRPMKAHVRKIDPPNTIRSRAT